MALPERLGPDWFDRSELLDPLVRPDDFFARSVTHRHLSPEGFLVVAFGALVVGVLGPVTIAFAVLFPDVFTATSVVRLVPKLLAFVALVGLVLGLVWILYGALLHAVSRLAGGTGAFSNTLAVAAYGVGPPIAIGILLVVLNVGYSLTPLAPDFSTVEAYDRFLSKSEADSELFSAVATACWQWYVWTFGLKHARDLSTRRAGIGAGVVALVSLLWTAL